MIRKLTLAGVIALALAAPSAANDSVASMGAGGLVLERTEGIVMRSEDLYVSAPEIRVAYRFYNRTNQDIETLVAFPLPDFDMQRDGDYTNFEHNLERFHTTVDGRPVAMRVEQRAYVGEREITDLLIASGVPVDTNIDAVLANMEALDPATRQALIDVGAVEADPGMGASGLRPLWTIRTRYYWSQTFPAGRELDVRHVYKPAVGGAAWTMVAEPGMENTETLAQYDERYCIEDDLDATVRRRRAAGERFTETWLDYILTTGANWAEPIGEFRLVVDKGDAGNLVSFCGQGVRRISPTQFEMRRINYVPDRDLSVLILKPHPRQD